MRKDRLAKKVFEGWLVGKRRRERPIMTWKEDKNCGNYKKIYKKK